MKYKAISIWQPWASLICWGLKQYETRSWKTNHRGKLVICSAKKTTPQQRQQYFILSKKYQIKIDWDYLLFGYAIAICDLTDCIEITNDFIKTISETERDCGDWQIGRYAWKLGNIKILDNPTPVKGQQRLWNFIPMVGSRDMPKQLSIYDSSQAVGDTKNQYIERYLARAEEEPDDSSIRKITHESTPNDSCVNPRLSEAQHNNLIAYLTQKNTTQRKYGSGWLSLTKAGGTARTDNKYLVYYYREHWRKRPYVVHIGNYHKNEVLEIAKNVRVAIDGDRSPFEIVKMIKDAKNNSN